MTTTIDNETVKIPIDNVVLFNPSSMYETIDYDTMLQYMNDQFLDNHLFYANYLNVDVSHIESDFRLSRIDSYEAEVEGVDITFLLDRDTSIGLMTSGKESDKIKSEFNITEDYKIFRTDGGFVLYDAPNNKWIYLSR